jgi:hypothetical protein
MNNNNNKIWSNLPLELVNHILSYRPSHQIITNKDNICGVSCCLKDIIKEYRLDIEKNEKRNYLYLEPFNSFFFYKLRSINNMRESTIFTNREILHLIKKHPILTNKYRDHHFEDFNEIIDYYNIESYIIKIPFFKYVLSINKKKNSLKSWV